MADLSASETRTVFEELHERLADQKRVIHELERQVIGGEELRKKLHNTILVNGFC